MKKIKSAFLSVLVLLVGLFCFAACGKADVAGTYRFSSMTMTQNGMEITLQAGEQFMGMITLNEDFVTLTLNEDGSMSMTLAGETMSGTWAQGEGKNQITMTMEGESDTASCDGETLVFSETIDGSAAELVLKKAG